MSSHSDSNIKIRLVSFSGRPNKKYAAWLREALQSCPRPVRILDHPIERNHASVHLNDPTVIAVVVLLEAAAIENAAFTAFLEAHLEKLVRRDDFRLFICLVDLDQQEFIAKAERKDPPITGMLRDAVQCDAVEDFDRTARYVVEYAASWDGIQKQFLWRSISLRTAAFLGRSAMVAQAVCSVLAIGAALWLPVWDPDATIDHTFLPASLVAVVCLIGAFPLVSAGLFAFTRYGPFLIGMHDDRMGIVWGGLGCLFAPAMVVVPIRIDAPIESILLGIAMGAIIDAARRNGGQAERARLRIDPLRTEGIDGILPLGLLRAAGRERPNPLTCPILGRWSARVFISYSHDSAWADSLPMELHQSLVAVGAQPFLDRVDIGEGSHWPGVLNKAIGRCDVFVALVDPTNVDVGRQWAPAELEAALFGKSLVGQPEIIVIRSQDLPRTLAASRWWMPVFRAVLHPPQNASVDGRLRLLDYDPSITDQIAAYLKRGQYRSVAVVPAGMAAMLRRLWFPVGATIRVAGGFSCLFAYLLAWPLVGLVCIGLDIHGRLIETGWQTVAIVVIASVTGNATRMTLAIWYQLIRPGPHTFRTHAVAVFGWALLLVVCARHADLLQLGWGLIGAIVGWLEAGAFCSRLAIDEPDFFRRDE